MKAAVLETVIIEADPLPTERRRALQQRNNAPGVRRLLAQSIWYIATVVGLLVVDTPWLFWLLLLSNGIVQAGFFGMLHEACHRTAFANKAMSELAGWLAALAQPMSPALMRAFHFEHHRHTHELERDPELAGMGMMLGWPRGPLWMMTVTGLPIVMARFGWTIFAAIVPPGGAWDTVLPFTRPRDRSRIGWEARLLVLIHGSAMAAAVLVESRIWWVYVGMLIGHALVSVYITAEHRGLPQGGTILERTRSVEVPRPVRWLLWNMPFHAEHHAWPAVPFHALPALHEEIKDRLIHRESLLRLHLHGGRGSPPAR